MPNLNTIVILGVVECLVVLDGGRNSIEEMGDCRGHRIGNEGTWLLWLSNFSLNSR
jgi:hypothetical protein